MNVNLKLACQWLKLRKIIAKNERKISKHALPGLLDLSGCPGLLLLLLCVCAMKVFWSVTLDVTLPPIGKLLFLQVPSVNWRSSKPPQSTDVPLTDIGKKK